MTTLITGGTGFVGQAVISQLEDCYVTSRNAERAKTSLGDAISGAIGWDPVREPLDLASHRFDAVVNMMGESIAEGRWTDAKKERIRSSRVEGTRRLVDALIEAEHKPKVLVSGSAVGYYPDCGDNMITEELTQGDGFLADVSAEWEAEAMRAKEHGIRVVLIRTGIVLGANGGALQKLVPLFRWGLGGKLGDGQQFVPWIHLHDLASMIRWAIENESVEGALNATAPNPVRNVEFTRALAKQLGRIAILPAPKFGLKLVLGEFAESLLASQRVVPNRPNELGFQFRFAKIADALADIL